MASKTRVFHSLILGLVVLSLIFYSVYNTSEPIQFNSSVYYIKQRDERSNTSSSVFKPISSAIVGPTEKLNNITNNSVSSSSAVDKAAVEPSSADKAVQELVDKAASEPVDKAPPEVVDKVVQELPRPAQVVQVIPPRKANSDGGKNLAKGVLTSRLYDAGHDIPNIELCPDLGASLQFLVLIMSAPTHAEARMAIRQTWGHYAQRKDIGMSFVLGRAKTPELTSSIQSESDLYGDIIGSRFMDSYDNLTLKTTSMMEWVDSYCPKVKFILKTDDDMFINIPKLISFVEARSKFKRTIFGRLAKKWRPIRKVSSKYYVSTQQYAPPVFPDFTTGPAYLLTGDIVHELYVKALNMTYLKLEDVFTTGVVAQAIKVKRVHANEFLNKRIAFSMCNLKKSISIHMVKYHEQFDLWKKLLDGRQKCG